MRASRDVASPLRRALIIGMTYALVSALWITGSDHALGLLVRDPDLLTSVQTYKGWGFVAVTSLLLFMLIYRQFRRYRQALQINEEQAAAIHDLSQFRETIIDSASTWINVLDPDGRVVVWNQAAEKISGYAREEVLGNDRIWAWLYPDEDYRNEIFEVASAIVEKGLDVSGFESRIRTRQGLIRDISWNSRRFFAPDGSVAGAITIGQDITDQRLMESQAHDNERQLKTLMDNLPGMTYRCLFDDTWTMKFVSDGCRAITGYAPDELLDNRVVTFPELLSDEDNEKGSRIVEQAIAHGEPYAIEFAVTRRDGQQIWVWEKGRSVEVEGQLMLEGIMLDITDRKRLERELARMATHDSLTGLFNRREVERRLDEEIVRAGRYERPVAVLWIDLDHFKTVNDEHGHASGDEVLRRISTLLQESVRAMDIVGRYGGEEFVLVLPEHNARQAWDTAERLRELVASQPVRLSNAVTIRLSVSIGIAIYPEHGQTADSLCDWADKAMYEAKRSGRNQVFVAQSAGES